MARRATWIVGGWFLVGCGGGGGTAGQALDCAWLESNNCWKALLASAQICVPPTAESGTLSADRSSCTYASGPVLTFLPATVYPLPDNWLWEFTISRQGQTCLHHNEIADNNDFDLEVNGQTFKQRAVGAAGMSLTCPDGSVYFTANVLPLFSCPNPAGFPITGHSVSSTGASFSFGDGVNSVEAFSCSQ